MKFYDLVENEWGEVLYQPTLLGKIAIGVAIVLLLSIALLITKKKLDKKNNNPSLSAKQLAFCSMAMALGFVLSNYFKVKVFPTGGSVTLLSMLVICLPAYWYGVGTGVLTGVAFGFLNLIIDPYVIHPAQLVVDYMLAFGALGLAGLFADKKNGLMKGYLVAVLGRYFFAVISGWIFFGYYAWDGWAALPYSLVYNASYIFVEAAITIVVLSISTVKQPMITIRNMARS
jgi:thiamine transporter